MSITIGRTLAGLAALCLAFCPLASADFTSEEKQLIEFYSPANLTEEVMDSESADTVVTSSSPASKKCGKKPCARKKNEGIQRTTKATRVWRDILGMRVLSASLEATWIRKGWRIKPQIATRVDHTIEHGGSLVWRFEGWNDLTIFPYQYHNHGFGSGYRLKRTAYFKGCLPFKAACLIDRSIELTLNLHADGTAYMKSRIK